MLASGMSTVQMGTAGAGCVALSAVWSDVTHLWCADGMRGVFKHRSCLKGFASAVGAQNPVSHCMKKDSRARSFEAWSNGNVDLALYRKLEPCTQI